MDTKPQPDETPEQLEARLRVPATVLPRYPQKWRKGHKKTNKRLYQIASLRGVLRARELQGSKPDPAAVAWLESANEHLEQQQRDADARSALRVHRSASKKRNKQR